MEEPSALRGRCGDFLEYTGDASSEISPCESTEDFNISRSRCPNLLFIHVGIVHMELHAES